MRRVKICCFCESWESGGIESFLHNVLCRMDMEKVKVDLVACRLQESVFTAEMQAHGIEFFELSGNQRKLLKNHWRFLQLLRERQYDVVHLNLFHGLSLYYAYLAKKAGVPVRIVHSHNTALRNSRTKQIKLCIHNLSKQLFFANATNFWACSSQAADFLFPGKGSGSFCWIPNGISCEKFRFDSARRKETREKLGLTEAFVIGNIGRLCDQKNQVFLLEIFAEILKKNPESRLLLIGSGKIEKKLKKKAEKLQIDSQTYFYGVSKHPERLLGAMDVFAFPSRFEGLGIAVVEAQAAGLPVVCSEMIPEEARVTPLIHIVSLKESPAHWAEVCLSAHPMMVREEGFRLVERAGFETEAIAKKIQDYYIRVSKQCLH